MTLLVAVLLAVASVGYAFFALRFATSARAMLPADAPYIQRYLQYSREFGDLDDVVIVVEATSLPEATVYAGQLVRELRAARVPLTRLAYRIDPRQFEGRALLYLPLDKLMQQSGSPPAAATPAPAPAAPTDSSTLDRSRDIRSRDRDSR